VGVPASRRVGVVFACLSPHQQAWQAARRSGSSYHSNVFSGIGGVTGDGMDMHRPVWVKLSLVFPRRPDGPDAGAAPRLSCCRHDGRGCWRPAPVVSASGEWLGLVRYQLPFADQRHQRIYRERQLLPAYSLRPRKYGRHRQ
jgi:hypothetical protein